jgi:hypothetical protein
MNLTRAEAIDLQGGALLTTLFRIKRAPPRQSQHVTNDANAPPLVLKRDVKCPSQTGKERRYVRV